jgi:hypothetical protein
MKKFLLIVILVITANFTFATHNMAGDISYTHLSGNTYKLTVRTFTNTVGTSADRCEIILYYGDGDSAVVPRSNGPIGACVSPALMGIVSLTCTGSGKSNEYISYHNYPSPGIYNLSVNDPNRSAGIMNVMNSVNTQFHLEATIVISPLWAGNSSPAFLNSPLVCSAAYATYNYNPSVFDAEGDSLYYENFLRGTAGYTDPLADNAFYIDSLTGDVVWDVPTTIGDYIYDIRITEWKNIGGNYYYAGGVMQEVWSSITAGTANVNEELIQPGVVVYPNPSNGIISFNIKAPVSTNSLIIYNSIGQAVKIIDMSGKQSDLITIEELEPGMYFYELLNSEKSFFNGKFLIIKDS